MVSLSISFLVFEQLTVAVKSVLLHLHDHQYLSLKTTNAWIFLIDNRKQNFFSATSRTVKFGLTRKTQTLYMVP